MIRPGFGIALIYVVSGSAVGFTQEPARADIVPPLVRILEETKEIRTFLLTVEVLQGMGQQARPAIPTIIRNAERLGILKAPEESQERRAQREEWVKTVRAAVLTISKGEGYARHDSGKTARMIRVRDGGEQLYEIAVRVLGDGRRWAEIYQLNPDVPTGCPVPGGTMLVVPARLDIRAGPPPPADRPRD